MRFLVMSKPRHFIPPDQVIGLTEALGIWTDQQLASGKFEQVWSFGAFQGGGAIANVDSLEELNGLLTGFPFGGFSEVQVFQLLDLKPALEQAKEAVTATLAARGA